MNRREGLRDVVVVGSGLVALSAAIGFARALPQARVTLVATPPDPAALADRLPAVTPQVAEAFEALGLDEDALVAAGAATHRVGEHFAWGDASFTIGEGDGVESLAGAALHQLWLAHGEGAFAALVPGAALAAADRFVPPVSDPRSLLSRFDYTLRLDADRARPVFIEAARAAGVRFVRGGTLHVMRDGGGVAAIESDGGRLDADLFIDASGPAALLAAADTLWIDWRATLPVDRLVLGAQPAQPSPTDRYTATAGGWTALWPLAGRTLTGVAMTGATPATDGEAIALHPRRQVAPFVGNVIALGDAAAALGPLGWPGFALALAQLELALALLPARKPEPLLIAEYNRRATLRAERFHAYAAAFYRSDAPPPAELAIARAQFGQRGTLPPLEEAMVPEAMWQQALIGLGMRPARLDPVALSVPRATAATALAQLRTAVAALPTGLPAYPDYLAHVMRGAR